MTHDKPFSVNFCSHFIVTKKLNDLQAILGAEILLDSTKVHSISPTTLQVIQNNRKICIPLQALETSKTSGMSSLIEEINLDNTKPWKHLKEDLENKADTIDHNEKSTELYMSHNIDYNMQNETLPPSDVLFDMMTELEIESSKNNAKLTDKNFKDCPKEYKPKLRSLLNDYSHRFSKNKLDFEITDLYAADLPTKEETALKQKVRRLPYQKYEYTTTAIKELIQAGMVSISDSPWRSNVILMKRPTTFDDSCDSAKSPNQTKENNPSQLYRICPDYRDLNKILNIPKNIFFNTVDDIILQLQEKKVISLKISSSSMIPIKKEDRYKTAFWVNQDSYEFNNLIPDLKITNYHINIFMSIAFSQDVFDKIKATLEKHEQELLPDSFTKMLCTYFNNIYLYSNTYEELYVALKVLLIAATEAKIKFDCKNSKFFTTNVTLMGYELNTSKVQLTMDKLKSSGILNTKKPSSLNELHSRLASFQYQSKFLPYLQHILYPLNFLLLKKVFTWGPVEERAWTTAKALSALDLRLSIPNPEDELVLTTDASKIAVAGCLFRVHNGKLELIATHSKYLNQSDLGKCSYVLESISLAYALKAFSAYLFNCQARIKIFTDAKSLIYSKRMSNHSTLLNSTLNYISNFVSLLPVEIFHIPGSINLLADVLSRAINDNLNCSVPKEHPISRKWAQVLPPLPSNFGIDQDTLYKFLTKPLSPEPQDLYDRTHRKLNEPRTIQEVYNMSKRKTPEERFYNVQSMLEEWLRDYVRNQKPRQHTTPVFKSKLAVDIRKHNLVLEKIRQLMDTNYSDMKGNSLFKTIQRNLIETSKHYIKCMQQPMTERNLHIFHNSLESLFNKLTPIQQKQVQDSVTEETEQNFVAHVNLTQPLETPTYRKLQPSNEPVITYQLRPEAEMSPKLCLNSNSMDIPIQTDELFQPYELKKVDLAIKFQIPRNYCALLRSKTSTRTKHNISIQLGLIDVGYHNYVTIVIQNISENPTLLEKGTAVAQLILTKARIPSLPDITQETLSTSDAFNSRVQEFRNKQDSDSSEIQPEVFTAKEIMSDVHHMLEIEDRLGPTQISVNFMPIYLSSTPLERTQEVFQLQDFENSLIENASPSILLKLPYTHLPENSMNNVNITPGAPEKPTKITEPVIEEKTLKALLAADLALHKKLTLDDLKYYQSMDPIISTIKDDLIGQRKFNSFILHKGIVYKIFENKTTKQRRQVIYIPTVLLFPIIISIHTRSLHPSKSQTYIHFSEYYYHPQARRAIQRMCQSCITCSMNKNEETGTVPTDKKKAFTPTQPREAINLEVIYLPKCSRGFTHALLIADLYSLYLSFIPLKSNSSQAVSTALRQYLSFMGVPRVVYSKNDPAFTGETKSVLESFHIQHKTIQSGDPTGNAVEVQVRKFLNAAKTAIIENPIAKHSEWHTLYPLLIIRLNTLVSKYGLSREYIHFQQIADSHLPIVVDVKLDPELEESLTQTAHKFRGAIQKFLKNKQKNKPLYQDQKNHNFMLHELVMRKAFTPASSLQHTYVGPYRIMELYNKGALLRDPRTGETLSATFTNLRKLHMDEFIALLPTNFDADLLKALPFFRYNRQGKPEHIKNTDIGTVNDEIEEDPATTEPLQKPFSHLQPPNHEDFSTETTKILRSGKKINVKVHSLHQKYATAMSAHWSTLPVPAQPMITALPKIRNRVQSMKTPSTPYYVLEQEECSDIYLFHNSTTQKIHNTRPEKNYKTRYRSTFQSDKKGILVINLKSEPTTATRVRFSRLEIKFY
jgi:dUTPase